MGHKQTDRQAKYICLKIVLFLPSLMDLAVDVFGLFDRDRGSYNFMRAGILGFFQVNLQYI